MEEGVGTLWEFCAGRVMEFLVTGVIRGAGLHALL